MPRESISKKKRFEILKRDNFQCQYCGAKSPDVTLEIDHIEPVAKGGTNEDINLVTACFKCNRGKTSIPLDDLTQANIESNQLKILEEHMNQIKENLKWKKQVVKFYNELESEAIGYFRSMFTENWVISDKDRIKIRKLIREHDYDIVIRSMQKSVETYIPNPEKIKTHEWENCFSKMSGIAYNIQKTRDEERVWQKGISTVAHLRTHGFMS